MQSRRKVEPSPLPNWWLSSSITRSISPSFSFVHTEGHMNNEGVYEVGNFSCREGSLFGAKDFESQVLTKKECRSMCPAPCVW